VAKLSLRELNHWISRAESRVRHLKLSGSLKKSTMKRLAWLEAQREMAYRHQAAAGSDSSFRRQDCCDNRHLERGYGMSAEFAKIGPDRATSVKGFTVV
jgi:hypothetical protein